MIRRFLDAAARRLEQVKREGLSLPGAHPSGSPGDGGAPAVATDRPPVLAHPATETIAPHPGDRGSGPLRPAIGPGPKVPAYVPAPEAPADFASSDDRLGHAVALVLPDREPSPGPIHESVTAVVGPADPATGPGPFRVSTSHPLDDMTASHTPAPETAIEPDRSTASTSPPRESEPSIAVGQPPERVGAPEVDRAGVPLSSGTIDRPHQEIVVEEPKIAWESIPAPEDFLKSPSDEKAAPAESPGPAHDPEHILSEEEEKALAEFLGGLDSQADMTDRARESLEETLAGLQLTPEEEKALESEIRQLRELSTKLDENVVEIAAFGLVSRGKSSVLNALLGREAFKTGSTHGTTTLRSSQRWQSVTLSGDDPEAAKLVLVDTPGIDEVGGEAREALARDVARHADLLLFIVSSDMTRREYDALSQLREAQKPIILVFNQIDRYPDADRDQVYETIRDDRVRHLVRPDDVVMTAAKPDPYRVKIRNPDGTTTVTWERPDPVIEPLKARILDVLHREGKALVALNTLLFAGDLHQEIVAHKMHIREEAANRLIWNFAMAKGAAVGLNPIPVADMAGGLAVDVGMIVALGRAYGIPLTRRTAITLVKDMVKALGTLGAVEIGSRLLLTGVQATLAGLSVATGGLALLGAGALGLARGATAAYTSYILGHGAKVYLQQGCQWGSKGIKTVIQQILEQAKADSVMDRLRDDLRKKVHA